MVSASAGEFKAQLGPSMDKWMYPFEFGTGGSRPVAPTFASFDPRFDTRDAEFLLGWQTASVIPTNAAPEINPAQTDSAPSTQMACAREPAAGFRDPCHQKSIAPAHIAKHDSGGSTTPSPMETALSGKRPFVRMRSVSKTTASTAATHIAQIAEVGSRLIPFVMRSATPFHCRADGIANCSLTSVAGERVPSAPFGRKRRKKSGVEAAAPARMPMT